MSDIARAILSSPLGYLEVAATEAGVASVRFFNATKRPRLPSAEDPDPLRQAVTQLQEYFDGRRRAFAVPLDPGGTLFRQRVWMALREIPCGEMRTYGQIAETLGDGRKARAVGSACGANPIPIIVPCHRVVGARGQLTGFSGGIERKRWMLEFEGALLRL